ncbi:MAG: FkbM family methyltransferase [Acidobacteriota bacterium]
MSMLDSILYHAWYGPLRRPLRPVLHRILPRRNRVISGPLRGSHFDGPETSCRLGIYELQIQRTLRRLLRAGDVVYDLGANNGYLSLLAARCVGDDGHVYSFDPLPVNISRISTLMATNRIEHQETVPNAVADRGGIEQLYLSGDSDTYTASLIRQDRRHELRVGVITLDEFIASHRRPDLVKMDVEGA